MRDIVGHMKSFLVIYILFALAHMKLFFNIVVKRLAGENYGFWHRYMLPRVCSFDLLLFVENHRTHAWRMLAH